MNIFLVEGVWRLWGALTAKREIRTANDIKSSFKIHFLISLLYARLVPVLGVRCCAAPTLKPGQTEQQRVESEPGSAWPDLHPFDLECRWKDEPALWTFLAPSSTAVDGPQVPYLQLI